MELFAIILLALIAFRIYKYVANRRAHHQEDDFTFDSDARGGGKPRGAPYSAMPGSAPGSGATPGTPRGSAPVRIPVDDLFGKEERGSRE